MADPRADQMVAVSVGMTVESTVCWMAETKGARMADWKADL
jgi:hypothetical protein